MGIPVYRSIMFGDNQSVVTSSTIPHSPLSKRWTALSYHLVREAIAAKILEFFHIPGEENPADIVIKHWSHKQNLAYLATPSILEGQHSSVSNNEVILRWKGEHLSGYLTRYEVPPFQSPHYQSHPFGRKGSINK